jgi:hypothetical protein
MVDVLLAPLAPEVYRYQRHGRGRTPAEITAALVQLAERVPGPPVTTEAANRRRHSG